LSSALHLAVERAREGIAPRARSLIVTVFGDSIVPHGGQLWMGSLIRLMAPLQVNERLVRTAVQRLTVEDWLQALPDGRRSSYRLTATGQAQVDAVYGRIYAQRTPEWDGHWRMLLLPQGSLDEAERSALKRELGWLGFGSVSPSLQVHPTIALPDVKALLDRLGLGDRVALWQARSSGDGDDRLLRDQVLAGHDMPGVLAIYQQVLEWFEPIERALRRVKTPDPLLCFCLRTLLIHLYRRALLRDPQFPDALMPPNWPAPAARRLCRDLYRMVSPAANVHLAATIESPPGTVQITEPRHLDRFGGL